MNLYARFCSSGNYRLSWKRVAANKGCAGVDGQTIANFAHNCDRALNNLRRSVATGTYRPFPLRQIFIPKKEGWRELGVPAVRDRIVQQALLNVLHPVMEAEFEPCSFAYRPGRSHLAAVRKVSHWRDRGYEWVLDADILEYFPNIVHPRLLAEVKERVNQPWILELVRAWIKAGVLTQEGIVLPLKGVPQGAVISPILSNVYLDDFDQIMTDAGWRLVRFADNFLLMTRTQQRLLEGKAEATQLLTDIGLQLHLGKTHLTHFDKGFRFLGHAFAGDLIVPVQRSPKVQRPIIPVQNELRLVHTEAGEQPTELQQAFVEALQQIQKPIPPPLFVVLGYKVREEAPVPISSDEITWNSDMATLYLVQQGTTVRQEQERFVIFPPKEPETEIPIQEVELMLVFGNIQLTTAVISSCLAELIPVVFLTQMGEYKGHLWSAESADLIVETAQFERHDDEAFKLAMARSVVVGKLWNSKQLLQRLNRKRQSDEVAEAIAALSQGIEAVSDSSNTSSLDQIRGYEGTGAATYFAALNLLIVNPGFSLTQRAFHPPPDPMNSLLSFGYTLLFNNVLSLLLAEGLNPYLGNLHGAERPKAYLAFDLMEEFRSPIVDTLVMRLVNQKILKPTDFTWPSPKGGVYLNDTPRRVFMKHFEDRICRQVSHPDVKEKVSYRRAIQLQIQRYIKSLLGNHLYEAYRREI